MSSGLLGQVSAPPSRIGEYQQRAAGINKPHVERLRVVHGDAWDGNIATMDGGPTLLHRRARVGRP